MPTPQPLQLATPQRFPAAQFSQYLNDKSVSIPLYVVPITGKNGSQDYKIGIKLDISVAGGLTSKGQMYEFDTGGQGFWVWPNNGLPKPQPLHSGGYPLNITYTSGQQYGAVPMPAMIGFPGASSTINDVLIQVAMIGSVIGQDFPIFGNFYGDFGAALQGFTEQGQTTASLLTALAQLPAPLNNGFIVDVGPYPTGHQASTGQLIVGLNAGLRGLFPNQLKMSPGTPFNGLATYLEDVIEGGLNLFPPPPNAAPGSASNIGVVFDTGAPSTMLHPGSEVTFAPETGQQLNLVPNPTGLTPPDYALLSYTVGNESGYNAASFSPKNLLHLDAGYINTGLNAFFRYQVMFDLQNGVIGFPPAALSNGS